MLEERYCVPESSERPSAFQDAENYASIGSDERNDRDSNDSLEQILATWVEQIKIHIQVGLDDLQKLQDQMTTQDAW